jgi:hypothetical protein
MRPDCEGYCSVCGERGLGFTYGWNMVHKDPRICAENLKYKNERLEKELEKVKESAK